MPVVYMRTISSICIALGGVCCIIAGSYRSGENVTLEDLYSVGAFKFCAFSLFSFACALYFFTEKTLSFLCASSGFLFFIVACLSWVLAGDTTADVRTNLFALRNLSFAPLCIAVTSLLHARYGDKGLHSNGVLLFGFGAATVFAVAAITVWMEEDSAPLFYGAGFGLFSVMMAVHVHSPFD